MELAVPVAEFAAQPCWRCGEPWGEHGIRPLHVTELSSYVTAAQLICPTPTEEEDCPHGDGAPGRAVPALRRTDGQTPLAPIHRA